MNIQKPAIFQNDVLSVFTDASITKNEDGKYTACAGMISFLGTQKISESYNILIDSTNNEGEIYAIYMGLCSAFSAVSNTSLKHINIYSDSKISVFGIREWIYNWLNKVTPDGVMISSSGKPVANQEIFILALNVASNLIGPGYGVPVNFYHVYGHGQLNNFAFIKKYMENLRKENDIYEKFTVTETDIHRMILANNEVDMISRAYLVNTPPNITAIHAIPKGVPTPKCLNINNIRAYVKGGK